LRSFTKLRYYKAEEVLRGVPDALRRCDETNKFEKIRQANVHTFERLLQNIIGLRHNGASRTWRQGEIEHVGNLGFQGKPCNAIRE